MLLDKNSAFLASHSCTFVILFGIVQVSALDTIILIILEHKSYLDDCKHDDNCCLFCKWKSDDV